MTGSQWLIPTKSARIAQSTTALTPMIAFLAWRVTERDKLFPHGKSQPPIEFGNGRARPSIFLPMRLSWLLSRTVDNPPLDIALF